MPTDIAMRNAPQRTLSTRGCFIALWAGAMLLKILLAARLPLFVDEAFYWQEGQHLAWAYSDLPGLTAWLIRLGVELGGHHLLAVRAPFLAIAALLPWWMVAMVRREFDERTAWLAGIATLLLPLAGTLGLLALPDVPMALATLLCADAGLRLLRRPDAGASVLLALGLAIGALSHYRFAAVVGVGLVALLLLPEGRRALRDPRPWIAIAFGAAAWAPLLAWNLDNAEAGLRFQLVDRHPWALHPEGALFLPVQAGMTTPLLFAALLAGAWLGWRSAIAPRRLLALLGMLLVGGFFVLGFFADTERVSFHWPLPGYLALIPLLPALLNAWPRWLRIGTWALAALGLVAFLGYYAAVSAPSLRERSAAMKWYPSNFAGWERLADEVREARAGMPEGTRLLADNFKIGAELGFALQDPRVEVLEHPLNRAHGRAPQLALWGLQAGSDSLRGAPVLLVVGASDVPYRLLLQRYHALCRVVGPLPPPRVLNIDHGRQRFLLFAIAQAAPGDGTACAAPAMAWIDRPASGARVGLPLEIEGWAFKDGVGLSRVEVTVGGRVVAEAEYGLDSPGVAAYWRVSQDPQHPKVGFRARLEVGALPAGTHWLGLRLHGRDGSVEDWSEQPLEVR